MSIRQTPLWCCCALFAGAGADTAGAAPPVTFDGSVGPRGSRSGTDMVIPASYGRIVGGNLFHSFGRFDVPQGSSVRFAGPPRVGNVVARVTGGAASHIHGTLGCDIPNANLFLLNPAGVLFGPGARVDVNGSFVVSTAHELTLADGGRFSSVNPQNDLLTTAPPEAFGFLSATRVSGVYVDQSSLNLAAGRNHAIVAGEVRIAGGKLLAPAGKISVVSVDGRVTVTGGTSPRPGADVARGDVSVTQNAQISVSGDTGGTIAVAARHLDVDRSSITARTSLADSLGGVDVDLTGDLKVTGALIGTGTDGPGNAGPVRVSAQTVQLKGLEAPLPQGIETASGSRTTTRGPQIRGQAGDVRVEATTVRIFDGAAVDTSTHTRGAGGDVSVTMAGDAYFANEAFIKKGPPPKGLPENEVDQEYEARDTGIIARTYGHFDGSGSSGDVELTAQNLTLYTSGVVTSTTRGLGNAGDVRVTVTDHIGISQPLPDPKKKESSGGILAQTLPESSESPAAGNGGNAYVRAGSITLDSPSDVAGAVIAAASRGEGRAGSVFVEADDVTIKGPGGFLHAISLKRKESEDVSGAAGDVRLKVGTLRVIDHGSISVHTNTRGAAGRLDIVADNVEVSDGGTIRTASDGIGPTGTMSVRVHNELAVRSEGTISAQAAITDGGNILLTAPRLLLDAAFIDAEAIEGDGGNLTVLSLPQRKDGTFTAVNGTSLVANSHEARGGNIRIVAANQAIEPPFNISASGKFETDAGSIEIATVQTDLVGSLVPLRTALQSPLARLHDCCASVIGRDMSSFVQVGTGGLPLDPGGWSPMDVPPKRGPSRGNVKP
jgi:filamentous hemagglutinin family protein